MVLPAMAAVRWSDSRPWLSGVALAIASIKPTFGLPLGILLLFRRRWRAALAGLLLSVLGAGAALGWLAMVSNEGLIASFQASHDAHVTAVDTIPVSSWMRIDFLSLALRLVGRDWNGLIELVAMCGLLLPCGVLLWRLAASRTAVEQASLEEALMFVVIPFCIYHFVYDALLLVPVIAHLIWAPQSSLAIALGRWRWPLVWLLGVPVMNYLATWSIMERLGFSAPMRTACILANACALLLANLLLWWAVNRWLRVSRGDVPHSTQTA